MLEKISKKKWTLRKKIVTFLLIPFILAIIILMIFSNHLYSNLFEYRTELQTNVTAQQFSDYQNEMNRSKVEFDNLNKDKLIGYIYNSKNNKIVSKRKLLVFSHGLGGTHYDYLNEINYFVQKGYTVFGFDNTGCGDSGGSKMLGLPASVADLDHALKYIYQNDSLNEMPLFLYGHSWGGFAVTAVLNEEHPIKAVVSRSAFNTSKEVFDYQAHETTGNNMVSIINPFIRLREYMLVGKYSRFSATQGLNKSNQTPVLVLYSMDDAVIDFDSSIVGHKEEIKNPNVIFKIFEDRGHDVVRSPAANNYILKKNVEMKKLTEKYYPEEVPKAEMDKLYSSYDLTLFRQLDYKLMDEIIEFYENRE